MDIRVVLFVCLFFPFILDFRCCFLYHFHVVLVSQGEQRWHHHHHQHYTMTNIRIHVRHTNTYTCRKRSRQRQRQRRKKKIEREWRAVCAKKSTRNTSTPLIRKHRISLMKFESVLRCCARCTGQHVHRTPYTLTESRNESTNIIIITVCFRSFVDGVPVYDTSCRCIQIKPWVRSPIDSTRRCIVFCVA